MRKLSITKILERCLLVGKKVLHKFPNDITSQLLTLSWSFENLRLHCILLISEVNSCPILMFEYSFQKFSEMCVVSAPIQFFSFWHYISIDNHWIDHSYPFWPPNPYTRHAAAHQRQVMCSQFMRKPLFTKLLERCLLVATEVPYKFQLTLDPCHWFFMS